MAAQAEAKGRVSQYKVVLLGDSGVGKTALILWYLEKAFNLSGELTTGASVHFKRVSCDGKEVRLEIWDTAGQERYTSLGPIHCRNAKAVVICYDITSEPSFDNVNTWISHPFIPDSILTVLVGCKADKSHERVIAQNTGEAKAKALNPTVHLPFFETSVVTDQNVDELFTFIASNLVITETNGIHRGNIVLNCHHDSEPHTAISVCTPC